MKLTFRQQDFLSKLLDIYRWTKGPIHYSTVAERLGLDNSTAYDMLRLLEQKGMATSVYTPKATSGPGRSNILFVPSAEAIELFSHLAGDTREQDEWEDVKAYILDGLNRGKADNYSDVFNELLSKIPEPHSPLVSCAEVITALLLNLRKTRQEFAQQKAVDNLLEAPASKLRMSILAGLILGLSHAGQETQRIINARQKYAEKYQASLQGLTRDGLIKLHRFTNDVWSILKTPNT
ncbi:MAG: hypothetical protein WC231_00405 [Dehalococcoidales bacterium]